MVGMLAAGPVYADLLPPSPGDKAIRECFGKDIGETCTAEDGMVGTCVIIRGGPIGRAWDRVGCLSPAAAERGRKEGWVVDRMAAPLALWAWILLASLAFLALLRAASVIARHAHERAAGKSRTA